MAIKSIGIDIREAIQGGAGKGRYCEEITKALIKAAPKTQFFLFTKKPNKAFQNTDQVKQVVISGKGIFWHLNLRRYLKKHHLSAFLLPTSYIPAVIAPKRQKTVTVIHDLVAFLYPENNHWFATLVEKLTLSRAIKRSKLLVTVSENTWQDLIKIKPAAKRKKHIIATPAVSKDFKPTKSKTQKLPKRYLLAVGTLQPRKNFSTIFSAFEEIADRQKDLDLCIVGGKGWKSSKTFKSFPKNLRKRIHFLGYVKHEKLPELYSRAQMLIFPSIYEGFGIPPLEAMACSCPVITSNSSSLPEVVDDAAIKVNPQDIGTLSKMILTLLGPKMQTLYKKRGLARAKEFSWEKSAKEILKKL